MGGKERPRHYWGETSSFSSSRLPSLWHHELWPRTNLADKVTVLGNDRPHNGLDLVFCGPFVKACGALPAAVPWAVFVSARQNGQPFWRNGQPSWQSTSPHDVDADRRVVLDRGNPPRAAVDTGLDAAASPLWAEPAPAGGVLHARH